MESAILVGVILSGTTKEQVDDSLNELELLADTAGAEVTDRIVQSLNRIHAATYIGKGKVEELRQLTEERKSDLVIFDDDLSTVQVRNLEKILKCKLLDRSAVILDIFASRAKTATAKTQVELAQLEYLRTRLTRQWTHLSRQKGGIGFKGPGETQIETDRRLISTRISTLKKRLEKIDKQRTTQRKGRRRYTSLSLIGYTNAGKSTLMNTLADTTVLAEDRLFATLDPTTRQVRLAPNKEVLLSDTVGFIRKLPHGLIESFKSTLDEVRESDFLLHVVDASHPRFEDHIAVVKMTLGELGALDIPSIMVFNKVDKLADPAVINGLKQEYKNCVLTSAVRGIGIQELKEQILRQIEEDFAEITALIPVTEARVVGQIRNLADIVSEEYIYATNGASDDAPQAVAQLKFRVGSYHLEEIKRLISKFSEYRAIPEDK